MVLCFILADLDIKPISLFNLRSRLTIIPQDPTLFSGSIRYNLDPFNQYTDDQLWSALEKSQLKHVVLPLEGKLDARVAENGENFSVGQRQLMCMARAILRNCKCIIMDEATATVDLETDILIQKMIRQSFRDCTVFTIAHRLHTIMDSTRIMVIDDGLLAEFDTPKNLIEAKGIFAGMVQASHDPTLLALAYGDISFDQAANRPPGSTIAE